MTGYFKVYGSKGWLGIEPAFSYDDVHLRGELGRQAIDEPDPLRDPAQFQAQAEHFSHCIENNLEPQSPGEEGLKDMRLIAEIYRAAGVAV